MKWLSLLLCLPWLYSFGAYGEDGIVGGAPDFEKLKNATRFINTGARGYETDKGWEPLTKLMKDVDIFDAEVNRMISVFCGNTTNKSVLIVGEPSDTYRYFWARLATKATPAGCTKNAHADVLISKIQGYMYVGTTERYWQENIEAPAYNRDVILYFDNLALLIGVGTSMDRNVGIEATYVADFKAGKLKTVAFINKYDYNRLIRSEKAYVLNAFQEVISLNEVSMAQVDVLVRKYIETQAPGVVLSDKVAQYLYRNVAYYQPNAMEPQRTMNVTQAIVRAKGGNRFTAHTANIAVERPYGNNTTKTFMLEYPGAKSIQLVFDFFETEKYGDYLKIYNANTNALLGTMHGKEESLTTGRYETDKIKLEFTSNGYTNDLPGFRISSVMVEMANSQTVEVTTEDVRQAIMQVVQVPKWIMNRDFSIVRNFPRLLDEDVVGVQEGKRDIIKQIKIGYVSGRTDEKPAGTIMLVGPTGTGKSYIAKKTADFMFMKLITMDMTQYATDVSFDRFLDTLSNYLILYPYAIYLFEEIDKASINVLDRLYFMMDEGVFYDKNQRPLFARGAFILMTTNAGEDVIIRERNNPNLRALVNIELQKKYRASFLNRFDAISILTPFTDSEFHQLAKTLVAKKMQKLREYFDWQVSVDDETIKFIAVNGRSDLYGARPMERLIENVVSIGISEYQMQRGNIDYGANVNLTKLPGEKFKFRVSMNGDEGIVFEADPANNSGKDLATMMLPKDFWKAMEASRIYLK